MKIALILITFFQFLNFAHANTWRNVFNCSNQLVVDRLDYSPRPGQWGQTRQMVLRDPRIVKYFKDSGAIPAQVPINNKGELIIKIDATNSNGIRFGTTVFAYNFMYLIRQIGYSDYQLEAFIVLDGYQRKMLATWVFHNCFLDSQY